MSRRGWPSLTGATGIVLVFGVLFLPGPPPKASDSSAALTAALVNHRSALVVGVIGAGVGLMALVWFFGVLGARLRETDRGDGREGVALSLSAVAGGGIGIMLIFFGVLIFGGTAFRAASMGDPAAVRVAVDTGNMFIESAKFGFAISILATCAAAVHDSFLSRRMIVAGVLAAAVLVLCTVPEFVVDHGIGQFGGGIDIVGGVPGFAWIIGLSIALARESSAHARVVVDERS